MSSRSERMLNSKCHCGFQCRVLTSWTDLNPARRFVVCKFSNPNDASLGCGFWEWVEDFQTEWQKEVIKGLLKEKRLLAAENEMLRAEIAHMDEQNTRMKEVMRLKSAVLENESTMSSAESPQRKFGVLYMVIVMLILAFVIKFVV